jgi:alginate O-acetyltransferase complex protein AlgI
MTFDSSLFVGFFVTVVAAHWALRRWLAARLVALLVASICFYAAWDWRFLGLIAFSTVVDWVAAREMVKRPARRRLWLAVSLVSNLGLLAVFKYGTFALTSLDAAASSLGGWHVPIVQITVPVGISFYTFQTLSYTIDVYRGRLAPARTPLHFALYVIFFPQLVAGPIVRAADLLPQFEQSPPRDAHREGIGLALMLAGYVKKVAIADWLAMRLVDRVFDAPGLYSSVEILAAIYGYAIQIYCDFSGYTDIAIGAALVLGYRLAPNFERPYSATSLRDFWRRWHISLSTWLRDYLYVPLGGNRLGTARTYLNLLATMLLGGLWHGAAWTFVAWGAMHGVGLAVERAAEAAGLERLRPPRWLARVLVFHFVCAAWVLFRAPDFRGARDVFDGLFAGTTWTPNLTPAFVAVLLAGAALHASPPAWKPRLFDRFAALPAPLQALVALGVAIALQRVRGAGGVPFIYFQF